MFERVKEAYEEVFNENRAHIQSKALRNSENFRLLFMSFSSFSALSFYSYYIMFIVAIATLVRNRFQANQSMYGKKRYDVVCHHPILMLLVFADF